MSEQDTFAKMGEAQIKSNNIYKMNEMVIRELEANKKKMDEVVKRKEQLEWIRDNTPNTNEKDMALRQLVSVETNIARHKNLNLESYKRETTQLLDSYTNLETNSEYSFITGKETGVNTIAKNEIFRRFIEVCKRYSTTYVSLPSFIKTQYLKCNDCNVELKLIDSLQYYCENCGYEYYMLDDTPTYKDNDRINLSAKYKYSRKGHFREAIEKYQGKQSISIPDELFEMLRSKCERYGITPQNASFKNVYKIINESEFSVYSEHCILIYCRFTNKKLPNITSLEHDLIIMNDEFEMEYEKMNIKDRKTALNVQYKLLLFLINLGHKPNMEYFNILKTRNKEIEHEEIARKVFNNKGWNFTCI